MQSVGLCTSGRVASCISDVNCLKVALPCGVEKGCPA